MTSFDQYKVYRYTVALKGRIGDRSQHMRRGTQGKVSAGVSGIGAADGKSKEQHGKWWLQLVTDSTLSARRSQVNTSRVRNHAWLADPY